MGFQRIILTLYKGEYSDDEIIQFLRQNNLMAVTMPVSRALTKLPLELKKIHVKTYAHTINEHSLRKRLFNNGVFGIYTDKINPYPRYYRNIQ